MIAVKEKNIVEKEMNRLSLEVAEIREISDIIFRRIENKIVMLNEMEASVDRKIASLSQLIQRAEQVQVQGRTAVAPAKPSVKAPPTVMTRQQEVMILKQRGLKASEIAGTLHIPVGEVELILGLQQ